MSGGAYAYAYERVQRAAEVLDTFATEMRPAEDLESIAARERFRLHLHAMSGHLDKMSEAMRAIEWNDSGDGARNERALILACFAAIDLETL